MATKQYIVIKNTIKSNIVDDLIKLFFYNGFYLFGGCVRDYIMAKKKFYPHDFDIGVDNIEDAKSMLIKTLQFSFDITTEDAIGRNFDTVHSKMILIHRHITSTEPLQFIIDISHKNVIGSNLDFDVNGIYMPSLKTFTIAESVNDISFMDIVNNINKKKFKILKSYQLQGLRSNGIVSNSVKLIEFVKMMERTTKMLTRGWKINDQKLEDIFKPCLIKEMHDDGFCNICSADYNQYELELHCCQQIICFSCALEHIKARFSNSTICCPYCRGDPFGWKTNYNSNIDSDLPDLIDIGDSLRLEYNFPELSSMHEVD